jgi:hypothetical protein
VRSKAENHREVHKKQEDGRSEGFSGGNHAAHPSQRFIRLSSMSLNSLLRQSPGRSKGAGKKQA